MTDQGTAEVVQVQGVVVDVRVTRGAPPSLLEAILLKGDNLEGGELVLEVMQHLGDNRVRTIAMGSTDGVWRGMPAELTGAPIRVPIGRQTLGRMIDVLGQPMDGGPVLDAAGAPVSVISRTDLVTLLASRLDARAA